MDTYTPNSLSNFVSELCSNDKKSGNKSGNCRFRTTSDMPLYRAMLTVASCLAMRCENADFVLLVSDVFGAPQCKAALAAVAQAGEFDGDDFCDITSVIEALVPSNESCPMISCLRQLERLLNETVIRIRAPQVNDVARCQALSSAWAEIALMNLGDITFVWDAFYRLLHKAICDKISFGHFAKIVIESHLILCGARKFGMHVKQKS
jgi:hypothetical protein